MLTDTLRYPLRIRRVLPSDRAKEYHPDYGYLFTNHADYVVSAEDFFSAASEYAEKYNLDKKDAELLAFWVVNRFCSLFYHRGILNWEAYKQFWKAVCRNHHWAIEKDPNPTRYSSKMLPGWTDYSHIKAIHDAILISAGDLTDLIKWYEFSMRCLVHPPLEGNVYQRLMAKYLRSRKYDYYLALDSHCHHEADFFVTLRKQQDWDWRPIATCGFRLIPPHAIIENLQGRSLRKELSKIGWRWLLVKATEYLLNDLGVDIILFRPAAGHWYKRQAGESRLRQIMDTTAQELRYLPFFDNKDNVIVYGKCIRPGDEIDPAIFDTPDLKQLLSLKPDESDVI